MWIIDFPASSGFWWLAFAWSLFQGYAGYYYGVYIFDSAGNQRSRRRGVREFAYGFHHAGLYFFCSLSGFAALSVLHWMKTQIGNWSQLAAGTGAIVAALVVLSIVGISGALPRILYLGNRPA